MTLYWLKIGAGALAIFGVGMTGITAAKKGVHEIKTVAAGTVHQVLQDMPAKYLAFRLDGERLGRLSSLDLSTNGEWSPDVIRMAVRLDDPGMASRLGSCNLAADDYHHRTEDVDFRCVSKADIEDEGLAQVGEVRFSPGDLVRPLYVPERQLRRLERSDIRHLKANLSSEDGHSVRGQADFDVSDRRGRRERGTVRLDAADGRALIEIRDHNGQELFRLRADDRGVSLNAADRRGRELIRLLAGEAGVHLDIKEGKQY